MSPDVEALLRELAAADLSGAETLADLQTGMLERAPLFSKLALLEPHELGPTEKARLREALESLAEKDNRIRERLEAEKRGVAEMLESVADARGAVRGYRGAPRAAGSVLRTA